MRRSRVIKKTSGSARWRGNCVNWMCSSGTFLRRSSCELPWKDIWKASGSNGCDPGSRTISSAGAATLARPRIAARRRWKAGRTAG